MGSHIDALISELDRSRAKVGAEIPFMPYGRNAFTRLSESLASRDLWPWQLTNRLYVMFALAREACPECLNELSEITLRFATHPNMELRSYSGVLAVKLATLATSFPDLYMPRAHRNVLVPELKKAIRLGISSQGTRVIQDYLDQEPGALDQEPRADR